MECFLVLTVVKARLRNVPDEDALDIKMMPASAPLVMEFQIPPVGDDLIFLRKYSLNAPTFNPKARVSNDNKRNQIVHDKGIDGSRVVRFGLMLPCPMEQPTRLGHQQCFGVVPSACSVGSAQSRCRF